MPVIGSGDIDAAATALRRLDETGVDGVMIGRGALTNPWMFQQVAALRAGAPVTPPSEAQVWRLVTNLIERIANEVHPRAALGRGRGLVCRMTRGLPYSAALRELITRAPSLDDMLALLRARCRDSDELSRAA